MAQPPAYVPATNFRTDELNNVGGRSTVRTTNVDAEFAALQTTTDAVRANLVLLQRDDGALHDTIVTLASLSSAVNAYLALTGSTPRGNWLTATAYALKDIVVQSTNTYLCAVAHTSGVFATDLTAVKWILISNGAATGVFPGVPFTGITDLTTTGNTILGDAATDTLNVGAGGIIKDSSGRVGIGVTPTQKLEIGGAGSLIAMHRLSDNGLAGFIGSRTASEFSLYNSGGATAEVAVGAAATVVFRSSGADRVTIDNAGNTVPGVTNTQTLGSAGLRWSTVNGVLANFSGLGTYSVGINVGNVAQASLTTFDWYEEGTWTPALKMAGLFGTTTYSSQVGKWTRTGNMVFFTGLVQINVYDGSTGGITFSATSAIPYAAAAGTYPVTVSYQGVTLTSPGWGAPGHVGGAGAPDIGLRIFTAAGGSVAAVAGTNITLANGATIEVSGFYFV